MDSNDFWAIAERDIEIQNPITDRKLRLLDDYCDIRDGLKVLDIGCGKAWVLRNWADHFAIDAIGIEPNPHFIKFDREHAPKRGHITYLELPAAEFDAKPQSFDIVMCLGATFALGGLVETLDWMVERAKPGGSVVIGEMTLRHKPFSDRGRALPHDVNDTAGIIGRHGAEVSAVISASEADFERYVSHHRHATLIWGRGNMGHPDHAEMLKKSDEEWRYYLEWVRPYLGWSIFVGRTTG